MRREFCGTPSANPSHFSAEFVNAFHWWIFRKKRRSQWQRRRSTGCPSNLLLPANTNRLLCQLRSRGKWYLVQLAFWLLGKIKFFEKIVISFSSTMLKVLGTFDQNVHWNNCDKRYRETTVCRTNAFLRLFQLFLQINSPKLWNLNDNLTERFNRK